MSGIITEKKTLQMVFVGEMNTTLFTAKAFVIG